MESKAEVEFEQQEALGNPQSVLSDPITILKKVVRFDSELDYYALLLWAAHTYMKGVLPPTVCLYLGFDGKKSSGKTNATKVAIRLAHNGRMYESTTPAALKRLCEQGVTLGLDEIDYQMKNDDVLATILKVSNSWNATAQFCRRENGDWIPIDVEIGGPKTFNFRLGIDDALRSRTFIIPMPSCGDVELIGNSFFADSIIEPVRQYIEGLVKARLSTGNWEPTRIKEIMQSKEFQDRVANIKGELPRNTQQAFVLLVVNDIMGWDLDDQVRQIIENQESEDLYEIEREIVADYWLARRESQKAEFLANPEAVVQVSTEVLRTVVNDKLREKGLGSLDRSRFKDFKNEIGFRERLNVRKISAKTGRRILTFDETVLKNLGLEGRF